MVLQRFIQENNSLRQTSAPVPVSGSSDGGSSDKSNADGSWVALQQTQLELQKSENERRTALMCKVEESKKRLVAEQKCVKLEKALVSRNVLMGGGVCANRG